MQNQEIPLGLSQGVSETVQEEFQQTDGPANQAATAASQLQSHLHAKPDVVKANLLRRVHNNYAPSKLGHWYGAGERARSGQEQTLHHT